MAPTAAKDADPSTLLSVFLNCTSDEIIPKTAAGVSKGCKVFGAAIFKKEDLSLVICETNNEVISPLLHGEVNCLQEFFKLPSDSRPLTRDCVFFATHEPCSLCLSAITWSGFDNHYFLFSYEETRDTFSIPYDIDILESVFKVRSPLDTDASFSSRSLYNKSNRFWTAKSCQDLVQAILDPEEQKQGKNKVDAIKRKYNALSDTYQSSKGEAGIPLA